MLLLATCTAGLSMSFESVPRVEARCLDHLSVRFPFLVDDLTHCKVGCCKIVPITNSQVVQVDVACEVSGAEWQ